jgi:hypothetical protein
MRKNPFVVTALIVITASTAAAQGGGGAMAGMNMDPTTVIKGSGTLPAGWEMRFDPPHGRNAQPPVMTAIDFVTMGSGFHLRSGPPALYFRTADMATGAFTVTASFSQAKSMQHETYGIFIGGKNLQDSTQNYLYFVMRAQDGIVLINHRTSNAAPRKLLPDSTKSAAIHTEAAGTGAASNEISIRVAGDSIYFSANGQPVKTLAKSSIPGLTTDGQVGLRLNHNLDVHIASLVIKK